MDTRQACSHMAGDLALCVTPKARRMHVTGYAERAPRATRAQRWTQRMRSGGFSKSVSAAFMATCAMTLSACAHGTPNTPYTQADYWRIPDDQVAPMERKAL